MNAKQFKEQFMKDYKLNTKTVIAYINKLEKELEKLSKGDNNGS